MREPTVEDEIACVWVWGNQIKTIEVILVNDVHVKFSVTDDRWSSIKNACVPGARLKISIKAPTTTI